MSSVRPRGRIQWTTRSAITAWPTLITTDTLAAFQIWPWMPTQLHSLAIGACVTVTFAALLLRIQVPVEASFIHGMLKERANPGGLHIQPIPLASGDDSGGASIHQFPRRDGTGPRHARPERPAPRPRPRS